MYAGLQNTAANLLEKFGQSVTLTKPGYTGDNQEFNPVTGEWETVEGEEAGEAETVEGEEAGEAETVEGEEAGEAETVEGEEAGEAETGSVKTVFVGITAKWTEKFAIEQGDSVALVAADGLEPEQNDTIDGWTILAVEKVKPAATVVLYKCHVRKQ